MKKILLASTGLFAASMLATAPVSAADGLSFSVGGKVQEAMGFVDQDTAGLKDFDMTNDTEVYFTGSMKLDNGVTVGGRVEIEGSRDTGRTGDIQYVWLSSDSMGTLELGETGNAADRVHNGAPDVGAGWNTRHDLTNYVRVPAGAVIRSYTSVADDKSMKVQYLSPSFAGFTLAAMYIPEIADTWANALGAGGGEFNGVRPDTAPDAWGVGLAYSGDYDGFSVGADVAYAQVDSSVFTDEVSNWQVGLSVGFGGFTVGGAYFNGDSDMFVDDYSAYEVGASYKTGPYGVSISWKHNNDDVGAVDNDHDMVQASGSYALGPGASLFATIGWAEYEVGGVSANEGWVGMGGVKLSF